MKEYEQYVLQSHQLSSKSDEKYLLIAIFASVRFFLYQSLQTCILIFPNMNVSYLYRVYINRSENDYTNYLSFQKLNNRYITAEIDSSTSFSI